MGERFCRWQFRVDLSALYSRTLAFEDIVSPDLRTGTKGVRSALLCKRLVESFGMKPESEQEIATKNAFDKAAQNGDTVLAEGETLTKSKKRKMANRARMDPRLLFPETKTLPSSQKGPTSKPLHMEICSGDGEWLCSQAQRDKKACWVGCELFR